MNAETQSLNDNTIDTAKILKDFVNKLNDLIYKLNKLDYDTKELYKVHDMLRYEVLNEEYVKKLCDNHLLDDTAKKIRVYDSILTDLSDQLDELHSEHFKKQDEAIYFTINRPTRDRRDPISKRSAIFHTISVLLSMALVAGVGHELKKDNDELKIKSLDTENVSSDTFINADQTIEMYAADDSHQISTTKISEAGRYENSILVRDIILGLASTALVLVAINICYFIVADHPEDTLFKAISNLIYNNIISLAKYKQEMKAYVKWGNEYHEEMAKLKTLINKTCQRIDKTIIKCTDELAKIDSIRQTRAVNAAENADDEYSKAQEMLASRRKEKIKNITGIIAMLSGELSKLGDLTDDESEKLLHTISISEDMLFEKVDDHLKIRDIFLPILKFLNLSAINFDDVDIRGVDFQKSNAIVFLRKVYNRDASGAKFDNQNIPDWTNCDGVNLSSAILNEDPLTLINLDKAITDENTIITSGFSNGNGRGIAS